MGAIRRGGVDSCRARLLFHGLTPVPGSVRDHEAVCERIGRHDESLEYQEQHRFPSSKLSQTGVPSGWLECCAKDAEIFVTNYLSVRIAAVLMRSDPSGMYLLLSMATER